MLHSVYFHCTEVHYFSQHFQVTGNDGCRNIHHLFCFLVNLHESLTVPSVRHSHVCNDGFTVEQLFLLFLVVAFQW